MPPGTNSPSDEKSKRTLLRLKCMGRESHLQQEQTTFRGNVQRLIHASCYFLLNTWHFLRTL